MSVDTAEILQQPKLEGLKVGAETYGLSLSKLKELGRISISSANGEYLRTKEQLKAEFESVIFEGLKSDSEYGDGLHVTKIRQRDVINGKIVSDDGQDIIELIKNGVNSSQLASDKDPRMKVQRDRDLNDLKNALQVEKMVNNQTNYNTRIVISAYPEEAIKNDGQSYWKKIGYVPGLNYVQLYHVNKQGELTEGSLSFIAEPKKIRQTLSDFGVTIPEDEHTSNYINYAVTGNFDFEDAENIALTITQANKSEDKQINTVEVFSINQSFINDVFEETIVPICLSLTDNKTHESTKELAKTFMNFGDGLKPEARRLLIKIANGEKFGGNEAKLLYQLAAYSAIEGLRTTLTKDNTGKINVVPNDLRLKISADHQYEMLAQYMKTGIKNNRGYSGCGSEINFLSGPVVYFGINQNAFGGADVDKTNHLVNSDGKGPLVFDCPRGHRNVRPYNKTIPCCTTCGVSVRC